MEKKIKQILEQNRLYESEYLGTNLFGNKEKEFFETYSYNPSAVHKFPDHIERNEKGHIELENIPFLYSPLSVEGTIYKFWILLNNGSKVLLKLIKEQEDGELELMFMKLAEQLKLNNASYDIGTLDGHLYTTSLSFLSNDELLYDYFDLEGECKKKAHNCPMHTIPYEINDILNKTKNEVVKRGIKKILFIDRLTDHFDRIPHNLKMILSHGEIRLSPIFDSSYCCDGNLTKKAQYSIIASAGDYSTDAIFKYLLSDKYFSEYWFNNVENINIEQMAEELYKEKGIIISNFNYELFFRTVKNNLQSFEETKRYARSKKNIYRVVENYSLDKK